MHISDCDETFNYWEPVGIVLASGYYHVGIQLADLLKGYVPRVLHQRVALSSALIFIPQTRP